MTRLLTLTLALGVCGHLCGDESGGDKSRGDESRAADAQWPQFRGPRGSGVAGRADRLPVQFGPSRALVWKTPLPRGHSSPCVWKTRIFLTGFDAKRKRLETLCLDRASGRVVWRRAAPATAIEKVHQISSPATPTTATDGERVYVYFGSYGLLCYDVAGKELWKRPLPTPQLYFGTAASPILAGNRLLLNVDQQGKSYLLAVHRRTGKTVWRKDRLSFQRGWSTPLYVRHDGVEQVVVQGGKRLVGYDLKNGNERWWLRGLPPFAITTPVLADGHLFLAASDEFGEPDNVVQPPPFDKAAKQFDKNADGKIARAEIPPTLIVINRHTSQGAGEVTLRGWFFGSVDTDKDGALDRGEWNKFAARMARWPSEFKLMVLAVRLGGRGDITKSHVAWRESKGVPEVPSPLYYRKRIYTVKNGGVIYCRDSATGRVVYKGRLGAGGGYFASPVAGDGKVYVASDRGMLTVIETADRLRVLARNDFSEPIMATPAIVGRNLYVRTQNHLYAFTAP